MLTIEEFHAKVLWEEHMRLTRFIGEYEAQKHFRKTLNRMRRNDLSLLGKRGERTEWTGMVEGWYQRYLAGEL